MFLRIPTLDWEFPCTLQDTVITNTIRIHRDKKSKVSTAMTGLIPEVFYRIGGAQIEVLFGEIFINKSAYSQPFHISFRFGVPRMVSISQLCAKLTAMCLINAL